MLILLPPSEGKAVPTRGKALDLATLGSPDLTPARERVLASLIELCDVDRDPSVPTQNAILLSHAAETLGLGPSQSDLVRRNAVLRTAPTARADAIYTGVLYDALDVATLSPAAKRRATSRVGIASSLFGIVRPSDRIPSYRLSGDAVLPGLGSVAGVWREALEPVMTDALGTGLLVDLRSGMYAAFWRPSADLASQVATVRVLHEHNGQRKVVSHFNKATKGRIVRAVLEHGGTPRTPDAFADLLVELGWDVEVHPATKKGTQLDVVVREL